MRKNEAKSPFGRSVPRGWELPQIATMDPLNPKQQLVAQSTRTRTGSPRTAEKYEGVIGWWTRKQQPKGESPRGMAPVTVPAPLTIQAWQPAPEQQRNIAWGAIGAGMLYVFGKMPTDPTGLSGRHSPSRFQRRNRDGNSRPPRVHQYVRRGAEPVFRHPAV
ncbi:hypothetical protein GCM10019016_058710 [Streptomyces prasinosporus]|uniref:Uncharacterized protein n=1 Tax=Streptomyces prasinosporus TaxID=68256 RepID=A0ABP6TTV8_9ACTN